MHVPLARHQRQAVRRLGRIQRRVRFEHDREAEVHQEAHQRLPGEVECESVVDRRLAALDPEGLRIVVAMLAHIGAVIGPAPEREGALRIQRDVRVDDEEVVDQG